VGHGCSSNDRRNGGARLDCGLMMKRVVTPEMLDSDSGTPVEIAAALSNLRQINRWFGGVATTQSMIGRLVGKHGARSLSLLEVAAGSGHVPHAVSARMQKSGIRLQVTLLDRALSHLKNGSGNGSSAVAGDALALPFADGSFDLVSCCLFAHHLEPRDFVQFVNESLRVSRRAVIINDLVRDPVHLALVYVSLVLFRSRINRNDAPASVRRAYTVREMNEMLGRTTAARVEIERRPVFRMGAIAWKR
jgi:ubiquinone/menaquinone biosynthesis C-methylase UbiE